LHFTCIVLALVLELSHLTDYWIIKHMTFANIYNRRSVLRALTVLIGSGASMALTRRLVAMTPPGMVEVRGDVRINGMPSRNRDVVNPGDRVTTGANSDATFIFGNDVYLLRDDSEVVFPKDNIAKRTLTIVSGQLLGVFGRQNLSIDTPVATIGIRGTGAYIEVYPGRTYFCLCYGKAELRSKHDPDYAEDMDTVHHNAPRNFYADPGSRNGVAVEPAKMVNHRDEELILLESLVGRIPLFGPKPIKMPPQ
jgi:hypothetical protein